MKTYSFNIFKCRVTITIERKLYKAAEEKPAEEIEMEEKPTTHEMFWPNYIPFSDYCEAYITGHVGIYSNATLKGYKNIVDNHLGNLMACDVQDMTETCIQDAFDREIDKGLSVKTLKGYKSFVLKVINEYYDNGFKPEIRVTKEGVNETT